ncbi:hypothetical protein M885DRAFT_506625 [Pelagophyceae sp. CCMP2097]|nr:hypothetical protein M885DRAFT_506625 [Pelagophyceae sp. CCMP2097]
MLLIAPLLLVCAAAVRPPTARRLVLKGCSVAVVGLLRSEADAACMVGDLSSECIGVYKEGAAVVTREDAEASGIRFAQKPPPPKNLRAAQDALREIDAALGALRVFDKPSALQAGLALLSLRPRTSAAAAMVIEACDEPSRRILARRAQSDALEAIDQADIELGILLREPNANVSRIIEADATLAKARTALASLLKAVGL